MGRIAQYQAMNVLALAGVLEAFVGKVVEASRAGRRFDAEQPVEVAKVGVQHQQRCREIAIEGREVEVAAVEVDGRRAASVDHANRAGGRAAEGHAHLAGVREVAGGHQVGDPVRDLAGLQAVMDEQAVGQPYRRAEVDGAVGRGGQVEGGVQLAVEALVEIVADIALAHGLRQAVVGGPAQVFDQPGSMGSSVPSGRRVGDASPLCWMA